jgi:hypothetical protein
MLLNIFFSLKRLDDTPQLRERDSSNSSFAGFTAYKVFDTDLISLSRFTKMVFSADSSEGLDAMFWNRPDWIKFLALFTYSRS